MGDSIGTAYIEIGAKIEGLTSALNAVQKQLNETKDKTEAWGAKFTQVGKQLAVTGAAITGALTAIILITAKAGDEFDEMAAKTGFSTEELSTLKLAADKSGTSIESVAAGMKFLAAQMIETASATDKSTTILGALKIEATDTSGKLRPMKEVLFDVTDKFKGMEAGALKTRLAVAIFGKTGMDMIPILNLGSKGLKENEAAARKLGIEWSGASAKAAAIFTDALVDLKAAGTGLSKVIGESLMPTVQKAVEGMTGAIVKVQEWAKENPELAKTILSLGGAVGISLTAVGTMMVALGQLVKTCTLLRITVATPIIITVGIAGGVALAKTLEEIRKLYEKNVSHRYIAQEDRDWQGLIRTMGEWTTIAGEIAEGYQKQNKYSKESHGIIQTLDDIWQKYENSSRKAIEAILKGEAGPAVRNLLIKIMEAHGGAAQLAGVHAKAEDEVKKAAVALDPALQAILDALDKGKTATKTMAEKLAELAKNTEITHPAIAKLEKAVMAAAKSGKILASDLRPTVDRLIELKVKAGEYVPTALVLMAGKLGETLVPLDRLSRGSAALSLGLYKMGIDAAGVGVKLGDTVVPAVRKFNVILEIATGIIKNFDDVANILGITTKTKLKEAFDAAVLSFNNLNDAGELTAVTANEAANKIAEMAKVLGIELPANIKKASGVLIDLKEEFKRVFVEMAQGWSAAAVSMLGITKTLIGEATKHNQAFFDQCRKDIDRDYETNKKVLDQKLSDLNDYYKEAMDEVHKYYDDLKKAVNKSYDEAMDELRKYYDKEKNELDKHYDDLMDEVQKYYEAAIKEVQKYYDDLMTGVRKYYDAEKDKVIESYDALRDEVQKYYDDLMDKARESADLLAKQADNAYNAQKLRYKRQEEDEDILYSLKYDREKEAIKNSEMMQGEKDAVLKALEIAYENEKLLRDRAREDAGLTRQLEHETRIEQTAKDRDDKLEALALAREEREKQLDLDKEARLKELEEEREAREKQFELEKEKRLEALALAREERERKLGEEKEARLEALELAREEREKQLDLEREERQKQLQLDLLALAQKHEDDLEAIRKADEKSQKDHDQAQLDRQNSLWGKIKTGFGEAIGAMLTTWLTTLVAPLLASITKDILPGFLKIGKSATDDIGGKIKDAGKTAEGALGGVSTSLGGIGGLIANIATGIATAMTTIATGLATVIVTLATALSTAIVAIATAIASAATILAAAAPALLIVGAIALAIYAGFALIGALVGGAGGGGAGDGMGRVVERQDRFLAGWDWWYIAVADILAFQQGQNDTMIDRLDWIGNLLAGQVTDAIKNISGGDGGGTININLGKVEERLGWIGLMLDNFGWRIIGGLGTIESAINGLPHHASGGIAWTPQLAMVAERGPEAIVPLDDYMRGEGPVMGGGAGGGAGSTINVYQTINAQTLDRRTIDQAAEMIHAAIKQQERR